MLSENTKAILLLTAHLRVGRKSLETDQILTPKEYNKLAEMLRNLGRTPADLLGPGQEALVENIFNDLDRERIRKLLDRGFLLSQALEQWQSRGIWVVSRADSGYPARLKTRLKTHAPPILFGVGDRDLLEKGGLAVVGSRKVDQNLLEFTRNTGALTANAGYSIVSGGAKGVDQASMHGTLEVEGTCIGVLADGLSKACVSPDFRSPIKKHHMVLISAVDPSVGFNVGNAMQRNKFIYALADAALVVNADYRKGGTWAGAIEQLNRFRFCPIFVRSGVGAPKGNHALLERGALPWPEVSSADALRELLEKMVESSRADAGDAILPGLEIHDESGAVREDTHMNANNGVYPALSPAERLEYSVLTLLKELLREPQTPKKIAEQLQVSEIQAKAWLKKFVEQGRVIKMSRPVRYRIKIAQPELFELK